MRAVDLGGVIGYDDIGMYQLGGGGNLALEALDKFGLADQLLAQHL